MSILRAQQISCEKQDRILFQDIDLSIESGEIVLLKGENGAGKTSLLRILVGLSTPVTGEVSINNCDVFDDIHQASERLIYIGHKPGISALLTAIENLEFWCKTHAVAVAESDIVEVLAELGLAGLEDVPVKHLSAGQQRRVALAKLWLPHHSNIWVLDEPFTALDVHLVKDLERHIQDFVSKGGSVLMTSHQAVSIDHNVREFELEYSW